MRRRSLAWTAFLAIILPSSPARADRIRLRGGGEIRGVILPQRDANGKRLIQTEASARPLAVEPDRIEQVIAEQDDPLDRYFARKAKWPDTAPAQYELGLWCEEHKLTGLALEHFRRATELDPRHAAAQKKLGRVLHDGVWMTADEQKRAQGLVFYKGKWMSSEALAQAHRREAAAAEKAAWARELQVLRQSLEAAEPDRREEAQRRLGEIHDPAAVPGLVQAFASGPPAHRNLLHRTLGTIPGPEARVALMHRGLVEDDPAVRQTAVEELSRRQEPETVPELIRMLSPKDGRRNGQVARLLADLGADEAVPRLIPLVARVERRPIMVPNTVTSPPQGITIMEGVTYGVLTGPVVGNGAVAYGGAPSTYMSGVSVGTPPTVVPKVFVVTVQRRNQDVLAALASLTGQDFGYDPAAWRRWWTTSRGPEEPVKRVRQP